MVDSRTDAHRITDTIRRFPNGVKLSVLVDIMRLNGISEPRCRKAIKSLCESGMLTASSSKFDDVEIKMKRGQHDRDTLTDVEKHS